MAEEPSPRRSRPPVVGLTGGLGAGKSAALAALGELGAATLSSDAVVHELLDTDEVRALLVERFGPAVAPSDRVDRAALAAQVFERDGERSWLEAILWPRVEGRIRCWTQAEAARRPPPAALVVEVPLLFEAGMERLFDRTVAVVADDAVRMRRAAQRGHGGVEGRDRRHLSQEEKAARADVVVRNDGDLHELRAQTSEFLATLET